MSESGQKKVKIHKINLNYFWNNVNNISIIYINYIYGNLEIGILQFKTTIIYPIYSIANLILTQYGNKTGTLFNIVNTMDKLK